LIKRQHGRDGFAVNRLTVICVQHFTKEDIYWPPGGTRSRLKKGAEPSIFPWKSDASKPERRLLVRQTTNKPETLVNTEQSETTNLDSMKIEDDLNVVTVDSSVLESEPETLEEPIEIHVEPSFQDKCVQTDMTDLNNINDIQEHSYSFSFTSKRSTFGEQEEYIQTLQEKLEEQSVIINNLKSQLAALNIQLQEYEKKKFSLEKFKDDDCAVQFYMLQTKYSLSVAILQISSHLYLNQLKLINDCHRICADHV
jgi:uncharacterized coiled-coil protein SlyX